VFSWTIQHADIVYDVAFIFVVAWLYVLQQTHTFVLVLRVILVSDMASHRSTQKAEEDGVNDDDSERETR
jgi:hypothetical protein